MKTFIKTIVLSLAIAISIPSMSFATEIVCGNLKGTAYYTGDYKRGGEWVGDGITGGEIKFGVNSDGVFDITFVDARNVEMSHKKKGAEIVDLYSGLDDQLLFLVMYPTNGVVETHRITSISNGNFELVMTTTRTGVLPKSSIMVGNCYVVK